MNEKDDLGNWNISTNCPSQKQNKIPSNSSYNTPNSNN
jgi:hypothetical protein